MMNTNDWHKKIYQGGFTLLEVMVAMVIFAIGLLGLAGIQANALRDNHGSYARSQAVLLAYDIVDRMRANPDAQTGDQYVIAAGAAVAGYPGCLGGGACDCVTNACTTANFVTYDLGAWKTQLAQLIPSGDGRITGTNPYTITVFWDEDRVGATGTGCDATVSTDLKCYTLTVPL